MTNDAGDDSSSYVTARYIELLVGLVNSATAVRVGGRPIGASMTERVEEWLATNLRAEHADAVRGSTGGVAQVEDMAVELRELFTASSASEAIRRLNDSLAPRSMRLRVVDDVGQPFHVHVEAASGSAIDDLMAEFLIAATRVVDRFGEPRFGCCAADRCDVVFVDTTKNASRRYCTERCASRTKMALVRARAR